MNTRTTATLTCHRPRDGPIVSRSFRRKSSHRKCLLPSPLIRFGDHSVCLWHWVSRPIEPQRGDQHGLPPPLLRCRPRPVLVRPPVVHRRRPLRPRPACVATSCEREQRKRPGSHGVGGTGWEGVVSVVNSNRQRPSNGRATRSVGVIVVERRQLSSGS